MIDAYTFERICKVNDQLYEVRFSAIKNIVKLFEELKMNNIHEQFYVFCYLLWNGYFSVEKSYVYNNRDIIDENNTIFLGRGCCRHNAQFLSEILNKIDISSKEIGVRTTNIKLENIINIDIKTEFYEENNQRKKTDYDHSVVLIKEDKGLFVLDPTMLTECEIIKKGKLICFDGKYKLKRNMFINVLNNSLSPNYIYNTNTTIDKNILLENYNIAENICHENEKLFNEFFDENKSNYEQIKKLTILRKNI